MPAMTTRRRRPMRMDFAPSLMPLDLAERPGLHGGIGATHLSPSDLNGIISHRPKPRDTKAVFASKDTGIAGIDSKALTADAAAERHARLEAQAGQLVSQTFFGTMLKQMRDSPFKSDLFEGGHGGKAYSSLYDQRLVEQMSRGAGKKLINSVVRKFEAKQAYAKQKAAGAATTGSTGLAAPLAGRDASARVASKVAKPVQRADNHPNRNIKIHVEPARRA